MTLPYWIRTPHTARSLEFTLDPLDQGKVHSVMIKWGLLV